MIDFYSVIVGLRYIVKINDGYSNLAEEKGVPNIFRAIVSARTRQAVMFNNKFWLPYNAMTLAEDTFLTGDAFKEKDIQNGLPIRVYDQWDHQKATTSFIRANNGGLMYLGMGTGKTKCTIDILQNDPRCTAVLIVCPKSLPSTWEQQFKEHAADINKYQLIMRRYPQSWTVKKRLTYICEQMQVAINLGKIPVVTVNYDVVYRDEMYQFLMDSQWSHIVCDESQKMKSDTGKIAKAMWAIGDKFDGIAMKILLSGTPMPHSPSDIWSQFRFYNKRVFGASPWAFQDRYCIKQNLGNKTFTTKGGRSRPIQVIRGYKNTGEMRKLLFQHTIEYDRSVITLPDATHTIISVPLEIKARKIYENLRDELCAMLDNGEEITVGNGLVKTIRLMQCTGGSIPSDTGGHQIISTAKAEALADVIDGIAAEEPLVLFCTSYHEMDTCKAVLTEAGRTVGEHSGRYHQLEEWQEGAFNSLVLQIRAGAVGVNLTRACYNIVVSTGHSAGDFMQMICRIHRPGQRRDVSFIHIHCEDSIDNVIYMAIQRKQSVIDAIIRHVRREDAA
jgi:SNF2 family DNA or RNA helicase